MRSELHEPMRAPYDRIFDLAANVERWPELLPHYRYVRRLPGADRHFAMGARRGPVPCTSQSQYEQPGAQRKKQPPHRQIILPVTRWLLL